MDDGITCPTNKHRQDEQDLQEKLKKQKEPLLQRKQAIRKHHQQHRMILKEKQEKRWEKETIERSKRLPRGLKGIWFRLTGRYQKIRSQNEKEMKQCQVRDRDEKQTLINRQLKERQNLQGQIRHTTQEHKLEISSLRQDISRYIEMGERVSTQEKSRDLKREFENTYEPSLS